MAYSSGGSTQGSLIQRAVTASRLCYQGQVESARIPDNIFRTFLESEMKQDREMAAIASTAGTLVRDSKFSEVEIHPLTDFKGIRRNHIFDSEAE
jgi:hypothetical protein